MNTMVVEVVAVGHPTPQGTLVRSPRGGLYYPRRLKSWRALVAAEAARAMRGLPILACRTRVSMRFYIIPTKGGKAPGRLRGDVDKLARAVLDAITGIIIADDELVVNLQATKLPVEPGHSERVDLSVAVVEA